jgi:hypothetical protein
MGALARAPLFLEERAMVVWIAIGISTAAVWLTLFVVMAAAINNDPFVEKGFSAAMALVPALAWGSALVALTWR